MTFEQIIEDHGDMVWRIALAQERNRAVAEELYQEICFALWSARERIEGADHPRAYVARIAMNQAVSHVRREVQTPDIVEARDDADPSAGPEDNLNRLHRQQLLLAAVRQLPLNWRQPVTLTLEGFKPAEIAYVMGTSANTVSLRLSRARKALKDLMQGQGHDHETQ
ncbi:RNA polymerase sigma factor [Wenzhouxiangella marina]|uniref:RNA polymerase sigma-54 factor RpoN n=1 Tax=Wenzhouxiangella marina TaxID=1579979 RepID=A0A0K0XZ96_9GAMM|nr:sigma-70 family RNA polymerase sigma factor [Wenzhouxiangella marina]AKS43013.1 RNA polymerase sigma-54 factor RpoN [Wenzhouxiangella marina]MBB6087304.1 RNA polymerase sigma-70 factor (ECF subfamily) [Wenzhouxiangella marina]